MMPAAAAAAAWLVRVREAAGDGPQVLSMTVKLMTGLFLFFFGTQHRELRYLPISVSSGLGGFQAPEAT